MKVDVAGWLRANRNVYFGNATTVRDYRVQLRGSRSVLLLGLYLVILIGASLVTYSNVGSGRETSIADAQFQLHNFYSQTMVLLGMAVCLIAPGLAATTVVAERQRQSLDLVFSAPVSPKYYLVGKMLSSFRYTWMVLILALPITAASVVLGGASWSDVVFAYLLLSLQGLIMTALALLISTLAVRPVGAIVWSYLVAGAYSFATFGVAQFMMFRPWGGASTRDTGEQPWLVTLSPFGVTDTSRTYSTLWSHHVPNWVFTIVFALLIVKLCLLGAGSILDRAGGKEIVGLRLHAIAYAFSIATLYGYSMYPSLASSLSGVAPMMSGLPSPSPSAADALQTVSNTMGFSAAWFSGILIVFLPFISCFGFDRERRYWPNGVFSVRRILDGTPGGGLPFLFLFLLSAFVGIDLGAWLNSQQLLTTPFWEFALYISGFWFFFWSVGRLTSSFFGGLKSARALLVAAYLFIVALPYPFLTFTTGLVTDTEQNRGAWNFYILSPFSMPIESRASQAALFGLILLIAGIVLAYYAETRVRARVSRSRKYDDQSLQTA